MEKIVGVERYDEEIRDLEVHRSSLESTYLSIVRDCEAGVTS